MLESAKASSFVGSIPETYDRHLGPVLFDPCATDLTRRIDPDATPVLDLASGTGRLTAPLLQRLNPGPQFAVVALDLNPAMQLFARAHVPSPRVRRSVGDAMRLPFANGVFAQVVCQHAVMFFPDKAQAASEVIRVLRPGGAFHFNVWAGIEHNPLQQIADTVGAQMFPSDPPRFYQTPFGYSDAKRIERDLAQGGFRSVTVEQVDLVGRCSSAEHVAIGLVKGNPILGEIQARGTHSADDLVAALARELQRQYGMGAFEVPMRTLVIKAAA
ncbi:MAG TPA: class I SAM-dependent methyltransferase [Vicinamibacterales bacterium]